MDVSQAGSPEPNVASEPARPSSQIRQLDYAGPAASIPEQLPPGVAVDGVIIGAMICVPFVTGLMAIVIGIASARKWESLSAGELVKTVITLALGLANVGFWIWCAQYQLRF